MHPLLGTLTTPTISATSWVAEHNGGLYVNLANDAWQAA
jgi:hypothetical protein